MKKLFLFLLNVIMLQFANSQNNVGINTATPHSKAVLDVVATDKGMLIPRITAVAKAAMFPVPDSTAKSMLVYQTDGATGFYFYDGIIWNYLGGGSPNVWSQNGNDISNVNNGNVGIGTNAPAKGKLVVNGTVGAVSAMFGESSAGVAIENNYPGIGFNSYYNGGRKSIGNGYGSIMGQDPTNGNFYIHSSNISGMAGNNLGVNLRMLINKEGNIGVQGNATPIAPFSFSNAVGNKILLHGTSDTVHYGMGIQSSLMQLYTAQSSNDIAFGYGSSTKFKENFRIKGNGKVGIGTSNPTYPVTLKSEGSGFVQKGDTVAIGTGTTSYAGFVKTYTNHPLYFTTNNSNDHQMVLTLGGKLGLGTHLPGAKIDARDTAEALLQLTNSKALANNASTKMYFKNGSYYTGALATFGTGNNTARVSISTGTSLVTSSLKERLSITNDGNVGINNTNPYYKLDVNGSTRIIADPGSSIALTLSGHIAGPAHEVYIYDYSQITANGHAVKIDYSLFNNNPNLKLIVTPKGLADPKPISVVYNNADGYWYLRTDGYYIGGVANYGYQNCDDDCKTVLLPIIKEYEFNTGDAFNIIGMY
jgi:hypothetical protein